jgi:hypothetical protein
MYSQSSCMHALQVPVFEKTDLNVDELHAEVVGLPLK